MTIALVGYDRETEELAVEYNVPAGSIDHAKQVAQVPADDPGVALAYELSPAEARDIAGSIPASIDVGSYDFFLEGYAD